MRRRSFLPDDLADLKLPELADHPGTERQAERECREARRCRTERDVLHHVQHREARVERIEQLVQHQPRSAFSRSTTRSVRMPRDPLTSTRSPATHDRCGGVRRFLARREVLDVRARHARRDRSVREGHGRSAANGDHEVDARLRGRAADLFVQPRRRARRAPASRRAPPRAAARPARRGEHLERALHRGGIRVVAVVDDRHAAREPDDLAAPRRRRQRGRGRSAIAASGTSNSSATAAAASTFARLPRPTSGVVISRSAAAA